MNGHLNVVDFLLTSTKLINKVDMTGGNEATSGLYYACASNKINIVEYLLTSPKLINKPDINTDLKTKDAFLKACYSDYMDIVSFFILNTNVEIKGEVLDALNGKNVFNKSCPDVIRLAEKRDMFQKIQIELSDDNKQNIIKAKI